MAQLNPMFLSRNQMLKLWVSCVLIAGVLYRKRLCSTVTNFCAQVLNIWFTYCTKSNGFVVSRDDEIWQIGFEDLWLRQIIYWYIDTLILNESYTVGILPFCVSWFITLAPISYPIWIVFSNRAFRAVSIVHSLRYW